MHARPPRERLYSYQSGSKFYKYFSYINYDAVSVNLMIWHSIYNEREESYIYMKLSRYIYMRYAMKLLNEAWR